MAKRYKTDGHLMRRGKVEAIFHEMGIEHFHKCAVCHAWVEDGEHCNEKAIPLNVILDFCEVVPR